MNELLKKLLEAEVLSEETRQELEEAMNAQLQEAIESAKKEAAETVRVELTEQWITERDTLIEAIDEKVEDYLKTEINELKEDIAAFRDLESEYATRLVETKGEMAEELQRDLAELIEKLDAFLEIRLNAEFEELREDINQTKKLQFGKKVFESFVQEYRKSFVDGDSTEAELRDVREQYEAEVTKRKKLEESIDIATHKLTMDKVLKPLSGKQREVMETILKTVPTDGLVEAYKTFIGRVLKETEDTKSEKEEKVLAESKSELVEKAKKRGFVKTGNEDRKDEENEEVAEKAAKSSVVAESYRRLAGLN